MQKMEGRLGILETLPDLRPEIEPCAPCADPAQSASLLRALTPLTFEIIAFVDGRNFMCRRQATSWAQPRWCARTMRAMRTGWVAEEWEFFEARLIFLATLKLRCK